jgi:hypothetical protein
MGRKLYLVAMVSILLMLSACGARTENSGTGWVAMANYVNEEAGIRGVAPQAGWPEEAVLGQESMPGTLEDVAALLMEQTSLTELPALTGHYKGAALTWDLYTFETQIEEVGPMTLRVDLALAEDDSRSYIVALVTLPEAYDANPALFDTVFSHALHALTPLE